MGLWPGDVWASGLDLGVSIRGRAANSPARAIHNSEVKSEFGGKSVIARAGCDSHLESELNPARVKIHTLAPPKKLRTSLSKCDSLFWGGGKTRHFHISIVIHFLAKTEKLKCLAFCFHRDCKFTIEKRNLAPRKKRFHTWKVKWARAFAIQV